MMISWDDFFFYQTLDFFAYVMDPGTYVFLFSFHKLKEIKAQFNSITNVPNPADYPRGMQSLYNAMVYVFLLF